jgi:hypothetical protein
MTRLRLRLSYANVTATLALFIALGGSSYAALRLPRNSVGPTQIRAGAVHSSEVKNGSLRTADLSTSARRALRGAAGPAGAQGPAGAPAARFFAAVNGAGALVRGDATSGGHASDATGSYVVGFGQSTSGCAYTATLGGTDGTAVAPGRVTVADAGGSVAVRTYDSSGNPADLPFHLIVAC